jgi:ABC-type sugar transport system ATPase subunit
MLKNVVINLEDRILFKHHSNLLNSFRMLIVGLSGCGKTVLLLRMLVEPGFIDNDNLIIY